MTLDHLANTSRRDGAWRAAGQRGFNEGLNSAVGGPLDFFTAPARLMQRGLDTVLGSSQAGTEPPSQSLQKYSLTRRDHRRQEARR